MLRVAVVGVGSMGRHHARNYSSIKKTKLVAICDPDLIKAKELANQYGCRYYKEYKQMLTEEELDAVNICTPTTTHKEIALYFIKHRIHVLIEKPIAPDVKSAQQIINEAKKKKVICLIGHIERYNPAVAKLKSLISSEELGDILSVSSKRVGLYPPRIKDANVITDLAVHDLDIATSLIGKEPIGLYAYAGSVVTKAKEDHAEIMLNFGSTNAYLQVNWLTPIKIRKISVTGTKGYCELDYITQEVKLYKSKIDLGHDDFIDFEDLVKRLGSSRLKIYRRKPQEPLNIEINNFINTIEKKDRLEVTPQDAVRAVMLSEKVHESYHLNKYIKL